MYILPRHILRGIAIPAPKIKRLTGAQAKERMKLFIKCCAFSQPAG